MTKDLLGRWKHISAVYHDVVAIAPRDREAYLAAACRDDDELRGEIEALLAQGESAHSPFPTQTGNRGDGTRARLDGLQLGPYRLGALLGAGGMGEVYEGYDPRLRRDVAVKVVPEEFAQSPERLQRLEQEARAAAALNHPNILGVHDIGMHQGIPYIVMERVPGETLAARTRREKLPLDVSIDIAMQIADALSAVHERGIYHRDLKPANVMVTPQGRVKILDFGLAKIAVSDTAPTGSPLRNLTTPSGQLWGTPAYMAPEQLSGEPTDHRADIYSLGVILFELVTGRRPFDGDHYIDAALEKLSKSPAYATDVDRTVPFSVANLIDRCLARNPDKRFESAAVLRSALEALRSTLAAARAPHTLMIWAKRIGRGIQAVSLRRAAAWTIIAAVAAVAAATGSARWRGEPRSPARPVVMTVLPLDVENTGSSDEYLGIGVADALAARLDQLSAVSAVSRETIRDGVLTTNDVAKLVRDLGVDLVVQGSLHSSGNDRLTVELRLYSADASLVWSGRSEAKRSDLIAMERQLVASLVDALDVPLSRADRLQLTVPPTSSQEAFEAYTRGIAGLEQTDAASIDKAISHLQQAVDLDPRFALAHAGLGTAFIRKYDVRNEAAWMTKAGESAAAALEIEPSLVAARLSLAHVYRRTGRNGSAIAELWRVLEQEPSSDDARRSLALLYESEGRTAEALEQYRNAVAGRPSNWLNHRMLGVFYFNSGRFDDAAAAFQQIIELRPDFATGYQLLGTTYQAKGDTARARTHLERAIALEPDAASYANLGTIHYEEGRLDDAERAYLAAVALRPNRALYHRNLGDLYRKQGRAGDARAAYEAAARLTREALDVNPRNARTLAQLAVYEAKLGQRADADRHIQEALAINPADAEVLYRRAAVLALLGDNAEAIDAVSDAIAKGYSIDLVRKDDDLESLRAFPAFEALVAPGN